VGTLQSATHQLELQAQVSVEAPNLLVGPCL
jgi:hypothetical protein